MRTASRWLVFATAAVCVALVAPTALAATTVKAPTSGGRDPAKVVLRLTDMPPGWTVDNAPGFGLSSACGLSRPNSIRSKAVMFTEPNGNEAVASVAETYGTEAIARADVAFERRLTACKLAAISSDEIQAKRVAAMNLPRRGDESVALIVDFETTQGATVHQVRYTWRRGSTVMFVAVITGYVDADVVLGYARTMDQRFASSA